MYCTNCNYPLDATTEQCPNCAHPVALPEENVAAETQGLAIEYITDEGQYTGAHEDEYTEAVSPDSELNCPDEYAEAEGCQDNSCPEECPSDNCASDDTPQDQGNCPDVDQDGTQPCNESDEENNEKIGELSPAVSSSNLNYMEKKARKLILEQEIAALKCCIQPLLDEIASLASQADCDAYEPSIDSIAAKIGEARAVDAQIKAKEEEYRNLIVNPCCEQGFYDADRYCGVCGEGVGETGWQCNACPSRNKDSNNYCRGCGQASEPNTVAGQGRKCSNPDCDNDDQEYCADDDCPFCGWPVL